jgi:hypothetical protein
MVAQRGQLLRSQTGSRGHSSISKSLQHVTESAVLPSEIGQLPDLRVSENEDSPSIANFCRTVFIFIAHCLRDR